MGGGEGAKERRRLKRLKTLEGQSTEAIGYENKNDSGKSNRGKGKGGPKDPHSGAGQDATQRPKKAPFRKDPVKNTNGGKPKFTGKKTTKSKVKKPKHLKRKLEQISENNADDRQALLSEIQAFEKKKELFSKRTNRGPSHLEDPHLEKNSKYDKTEKEDSSTVPNETDDAAKPRRRRGRKNTSNEVISNKNEPDFIRGPVNPTQKIQNVAPQRKVMQASSEGNISGRAEDGTGTETPVENDKPSTNSSEKKDEDSSTDGESNAEIIDGQSAEVDGAKSANKKDNSSSSSSDSDLSDSDDELEATPRRQRGKRRRGKVDTSAVVSETNNKDDVKKECEESGKGSDPNKKTSKKDDARRCKGRKPVTDFQTGNSYPATVVYTKPFGVFFDIGCHSDAFCHVSRLSDDFVESPTDKFKAGDKAEVRVIEIDRHKKRITLSLQSEARIKDEQASKAAREERRQTRQKKPAQGRIGRASTAGASSQDHMRFDSNESAKLQPGRGESTMSSAWEHRAQQPSRPKVPSGGTALLTKDESQMTPAEVKRARKLARRAARREAAQGADEVPTQ